MVWTAPTIRSLIAAEKTGRHASLIELDPKYVDVIVRRWQDFTGETAVLESSGQSFDNLKSGEPPPITADKDRGESLEH
jgi:hypothetical protein